MPELTPVEMFVGTSVKQDATDFSPRCVTVSNNAEAPDS